MQRRHAAIALAALPVCAALAHESKPHAKKTQPLVKEQKDWGVAGDARAAKRTLVVRMTDQMRFAPDMIEIKLGETVRFDIRNDGRMLHEMVIGTAKELEDHARTWNTTNPIWRTWRQDSAAASCGPSTALAISSSRA